ncbi:MAG: hypothetical protein AAGI46_07135 [Planctomycetota bacterium]
MPCRLLLLVVLCLTPQLLAQTGPAILLDEFRREDQFELETAWFVGLPTKTGGVDAMGNDFDLRFDQLRLAGRLRLSPGRSDSGLAQAQPRLGAQLTTLAFDTLDPEFPRRLSDGSVGFGMGIFKIDEWIGGVTLGVGYASAASSSSPFDVDAPPDGEDIAPFLREDGNALYGQANFVIGRTWESGDAFGLVLNYDGNRTFLPDIPLPGFQYRKRVNSQLSYALGLPLTGLQWDPAGPFSVNIDLSVPDDLRGRVAFDFATFEGSPVQIYGAVSRRATAAHWDELGNGNRRVFFFQSLAEVGFSIEPEADEVRFLIAGGWDFDRRLETGYDTRNLTLLSEINTGPFIRVSFEMRL